MNKREFLGAALARTALPGCTAAAPHPADRVPEMAARFGACPWALYRIEVQGRMHALTAACSGRSEGKTAPSGNTQAPSGTTQA